jgi:molybdenum cofactor synthesis domain-containing protein
MITVDEALAIISEACAPGVPERISLREGFHRVLAREIRSDVDWPPFDTSAMDGYAVRLADVTVAGAALSERPGLVAAGDRPAAPLAPGEAVRVMTGAPVPDGTEAVVPVEEIHQEAGRIVTRYVPRLSEHLRRRGESVAAGSVLLPEGRRLTPADVALTALAGADPLEVHRRPRVSIAVTGNELVPSAGKPGPGQLRDSNGPMLLSLCRGGGWCAAARPVVRDEEGAVRDLFAEAGREEDVLITSGGVSAGDLDLLPEQAERSGFEVLFHRVAIRPGKPIAFGRRGKTLWFGLPGNPVSTSVCFHVFVRHALDSLEGAQPPGPRFVPARLSRDISIRGRRETYRDALMETVDSENRVAALASRGSHDLAAHARANALIRIPADAEHLTAGTLVECLIL